VNGCDAAPFLHDGKARMAWNCLEGRASAEIVNFPTGGRMHRSIRLTLYASVVVVACIAGAAGFVISQTRVPPEAINAAVTRREEAIERAWQLPVASTFNREMEWQSNASLCGPASLANIFRSLGDDNTARVETVLAGTGRCPMGVCILGLTLDELADVARRNTGRTVTVLRDLSPAEFREHMKLANDPSRRYIINFSRKAIFGSGAGHHSPVGGYLEAEDLVFVLDVNREFQPWLIERARLYDAMNTFDGHAKRGLLLIE
jgi:Phytochelatin synthase